MSVPEIPLIARADAHGDRTAIITPEGTFTYRQLLQASGRVAACLLDGEEDLRERRVAFLTPPGFTYAATQWGIWRAGGIAVPLCVSHPRPELEYVVEDAGAEILVAHPEYEAALHPIAAERGLRYLLTPDALSAPEGPLPRVAADRRALILYTSGTTSKPKGVVTTHRNIEAQVTSLVEAWEWTPEDHILHVLPLHHIHGILNVLTCALWAGARCRMLPRFSAEEVWTRFLEDDLTLFMAVPTIYVRLIAAWEAASPKRQRAMSAACAKLRLMVSGSAALPVSVLEQWQRISGHVLLERYGMTEIGMALSNPLHGRRVPGHVGTPLPGVEVRLVGLEAPTGSHPQISQIDADEWKKSPLNLRQSAKSADNSGLSSPKSEIEAGEIQVRGPGVFREYWGRPEATAQAFRDGWFSTGDVAVLEDGCYRILGRASVDIIKTGGYKVSALEIEEVLRTHPEIAECAVVGVADSEWGERVCAAIIPKGSDGPTLESLRQWGRERLAAYKLPTRILLVAELPRNAMGKVTKPEVARLFPSAG